MKRLLVWRLIGSYEDAIMTDSTLGRSLTITIQTIFGCQNDR